MKRANKLKTVIIKKIFELSQDSVEEIDDGLTTSEETKALCRALAAEGCVLLKNDNAALPINKDEKVAVFGRCQQDYFYVGYGSGGDVKPPYRISPMEAFKAEGVSYDESLASIYDAWRKKNVPYDGTWGDWPMCYDEMPLTEEMVTGAASRCEKALVFIGRSAGEDRESKKEEGSWYLTKIEKENLELIRSEFEKVIVVLNCGSILDMSWAEDCDIDGLLYAWQGGQESGNALCDILTGKVCPSGKLTDTIAPIEEYPSTEGFGNKKVSVYTEDIYVGYRYFETFERNKVIYPFGFGLSYTKFSVSAKIAETDGSKIKIVSTITNAGDYPGKEVLQIYMKAPEGELGKPARELIAFAKTKEIEPGKKSQITLTIDLRDFASYDDTGATGHKNSYILEAGEYRIFAGTDVRSAREIGSVDLEEIVVRKTLEACPPEKEFERMVCRFGEKMYKPVPAGTRNLRERILKQVPLPIKKTKEKYRLIDVKNNKITMDEFIATLSTDELECLSRGSIEGMNSSYGAVGNAAVFGGTQDSLTEKGVPAICTNDGPSGARLQAHSTLFPIGAVLASSFNMELIEATMAKLGEEVIERKSQVLLAPGMNIHRNPLCGRNFEYFSEDPYLTGKIAAAYVKGVQRAGASAVPKHICCNNQETGRNINNSIVSQRALREIYLKGFEICLKEAKPDFVMTSYNKINGVYSYYNYDLCTVILRDEFGFEGLIMTDWWMKDAKSKEFKNVSNQALRVRAGNNLYMPGGPGYGKGKPDDSIVKSLTADDGISLGELQRNARAVLTYCMRFVE